jgi:poly-gamma-glutamate capsule biosynthesis protein CapA/YwtB (metallophosphatase superfamily)
LKKLIILILLCVFSLTNVYCVDNILPEKTESVKLTFLGDVCLGTNFGKTNRFHKMFTDFGAEYFFRELKQGYSDSDFVLANLENVFTTSQKGVQGKIYTFKASPKYVDVLKESGITHFAVVNNHMQDYGQDSFNESLDYLDSAGLKFFGSNNYKSSSVELGSINVDRKEIIEKDGIKIGLLSYNGFYDSYRVEKDVEADINYFKEQDVDYIIAYLHWGGQNTYSPTVRQQSYGKTLINLGVDLIIGGHPHRVQPMEVYNGKRIYYSLGDSMFVPPYYVEDSKSLAVELILEKNSDGSIVEHFTDKHFKWSGDDKINTYQPSWSLN